MFLLITVGICEKDSKIKQLVKHFFIHQGIKCSNDNENTDTDFIFNTPKNNTHYDILIENKALKSSAKADYIHLLNSDDITVLSDCSKCIFITYGLNRFATATASSIHYDENCLSFQYCLQRNITSLKGKIIECQEFPVCICNIDLDIQGAIAFTTLSLIAGIKPEAMKKING